MLATTGALPLGEEWAYEVKWDGVRALVAVEGGSVKATSRNGNDITGAYPELLTLGGQTALLDGELVALVDGRPDFGALQPRMHVRSPSAALVRSTPVTFVPFDLLHLADTSLLDRSYDERRALLDELGLDAPQPFYGDGQVLLESTRAQGLEGLVAKRRDSAYLPGRRSDCWVKVKHVHRQSALVCGWKEGEGGRSGKLGSLLLGVHSDQGLLYAGHVGTGFTAATLHQLAELLAPLARTSSPYDDVVPPEHARVAHWAQPELVVDVDYTAWTKDGRLRHPSYKGIRTDLDPRGVVRE
ncbi:MAG: polymerase LigD, ligase domain protein [Frankiales bacterium]|nr:polymerase LigD, ligase domain protein [Frankiales bacterium]